MDQERPPTHEQREIQREGLEALIAVDVREGPEAEGEGWQVSVVEHLRLQVPADARQAWLAAELQTWDPWLREQKGFMRRELLWDGARQEGVLLIHWSNRDDWKAIPESEVTAIQQQFESSAKQILSLPSQSENPFPLVFAGESSVS